MDRPELLKQLTDKTLRYFEESGLPPVKCKQMVQDRMQTWKTLPLEELQELLDQAD
jgi:hypothetical protein